MPDVLEKHTICVNRTVYPDCESYLKVFLSQGGIIEAYPPSDSVTSITVSLNIELDGQFSIVCSGDHLHAESQFSCWGLSFPQSSVEAAEINSYCTQIVEQCKLRNIFGFVDVDFVTFIDAKSDKQQIWATDLSIGYSEHVSMYQITQFITRGYFDSQTHTFSVKVKQGKARTKLSQASKQDEQVLEIKINDHR